MSSNTPSPASAYRLAAGHAPADHAPSSPPTSPPGASAIRTVVRMWAIAAAIGGLFGVMHTRIFPQAVMPDDSLTLNVQMSPFAAPDLSVLRGTSLSDGLRDGLGDGI